MNPLAYMIALKEKTKAWLAEAYGDAGAKDVMRKTAKKTNRDKRCELPGYKTRAFARYREHLHSKYMRAYKFMESATPEDIRIAAVLSISGLEDRPKFDWLHFEDDRED